MSNLPGGNHRHGENSVFTDCSRNVFLPMLRLLCAPAKINASLGAQVLHRSNGTINAPIGTKGQIHKANQYKWSNHVLNALSAPPPLCNASRCRRMSSLVQFAKPATSMQGVKRLCSASRFQRQCAKVSQCSHDCLAPMRKGAGTTTTLIRAM